LKKELNAESSKFQAPSKYGGRPKAEDGCRRSSKLQARLAGWNRTALAPLIPESVYKPQVKERMAMLTTVL
jgi:hypothetical protein